MIPTWPDYKIIDMHTHIGPEYPLCLRDYDADGIVKVLDEANIEFIIATPCEDLFTGNSKREVIIDAMTRYPDRIKGYYGINPNLKNEPKEIYEAFKKYPGFMGFKFLPDYHRTALTDPLYERFFAIADAYNMLILSHTWGLSMNSETCNSADKVAAVLEKYQNITFIMGHSIQGQIDEAIKIAAGYPNAYLDLCDTGRINGVIEKMVTVAGPEKVLFGTDCPMQSPLFCLGAVMAAEISERDRRLILRDNALRILSQTGRPS
jgi:predicted TIM-barrel fold metal-dependent hydrolase